jgi:hypothetical protein
MRRFIICSLIIAHSVSSFCQQPDRPTLTPNQHYLAKSKKQGRAAVILLLGGLLSAGLASGMAMSNLGGLGDPNSPPPKNEHLGDILGYSALGMITTSIPFFILSAKNKKKARQISF